MVAALGDAHAAIDSFVRLDSPAASFRDDKLMEDRGEEAEQMVGEVDEGLRDCALQGSKRQKWLVLPSCPLVCRMSCEVVETATPPPLDVEGRRRTAMYLLLQFNV